MPEVQVATTDHRETVLTGSTVDDFKSKLLGNLLRMEDPGYEPPESAFTSR